MVVGRHIHVQFVEVYVLLVMRSDQVVKSMTRNGEHGLAIAFRIVQAVQQVDAAGARSREAHTKAARVLGIAASCKRSTFFVPNLDELDCLLMRSKRFKDSVDAVARKAEDRFDSPINLSLDQQVCYCFRHAYPSYLVLRF
jgi:hypothetical protein